MLATLVVSLSAVHTGGELLDDAESGDAATTGDDLVTLLDEYSQNELSLAGLKGRDDLWAARLLSATEASEYEAVRSRSRH